MKRRKIIAWCGLVAVLALPIPGSPTGRLAAQGGAMLREALDDPAAIFAGRSPGARAGGALVQSKPLAAITPTERVLSPVLERPATPIPADLDNLANRVMEVVSPNASPLPGGGANLTTPPGLPGSSGGVLPPPGGGGGGIIPPGPPSPLPPLPPVVSPVPEPATWVMMIAGIGLIGLQLRRRHAGTKLSA